VSGPSSQGIMWRRRGITGRGQGILAATLLLALTACGSDADPARTTDLTTVSDSSPTEGSQNTTVPGVETEGRLTVETSLGTWQWVRDDEGLPGEGFSEKPAWVELPDPPRPAIEELVWPQIDSELQGNRWGPLGGFPVSSGEITITPALLNGHIDWSSFYSNDDGWVESRWRPLDGDCPWVEVCEVQEAALEIVAIREEQVFGVGYREDGVLAVLTASIVPGDPDAVEFRDEETGDLVLRLEATENLSALRLLRAGGACDRQDTWCGGGVYLWEMYVDGVGWIDPPWQGLDVSLWPGVTAGVHDDGFWVVGFEGPRDSSTLHTWGSSDGVNWEEIATPFPLGSSFPNGFQVELVGGELVILTPNENPDEPRIPHRALRLADGRFTEVKVDLSPLGESQIHELTSTSWAWMATTWIPNRWAGVCRLWVSPDGTTWEGITMPDGSDTDDTVHVLSYTFNDDGTGIAEAPGKPTPAESVTAGVAASDCSITDAGSVQLQSEHLIDGIGTVHDGENYPDFFYTSWIGGFVGPER
jgi:hypothetical protein